MRAILCALVLLATLPNQAAESVLRLFNYSEYMDPEIITDFEKAERCKVVVDLFEDGDAMVAKVKAGGGATFDVIVSPDVNIAPLVKLNLLSPLRLDAFPNLKNIDPKFLKPPFDPENKYTVPYQWGTMGIFARQNASKPLEPTWGLLFDPKKQPGPFLLIDSMRDTIGAALKYKGYSMNSTNPAQLKEARDLVAAAKKRALGFEGSVGGKSKVLDKSAAAAIVYSMEAARAHEEDTNTVYILPKEGAEIYLDNMAILAKAPNKPLAEKFINYILDDKVGARLSAFVGSGTPNRAARAHMTPEQLENPIIYPSAETMERLEFLRDLGPSLRLYDEIWTQIKGR